MTRASVSLLPSTSSVPASTAARDRSSARAAAVVTKTGVPRLALSPAEAAASLGCSRDYFDERVAPELRVVRRGRRVLVPIAELERWLDRNAARLTLGRRT
jgi:excisionase family DNA binding protein